MHDPHQRPGHTKMFGNHPDDAIIRLAFARGRFGSHLETSGTQHLDPLVFGIRLDFYFDPHGAPFSLSPADELERFIAGSFRRKHGERRKKCPKITSIFGGDSIRLLESVGCNQEIGNQVRPRSTTNPV